MSRYGLDLGRSSVKLISCNKKAIRGAERRIDPDLRGAERHTALVTALKESAAELGLKSRAELHTAVPRAAAIVKRLALPNVPRDELEPMIQFQAAKGLPFDMEEMVLAWAPLGPAPGIGQEILFAAVQRQVLDELEQVVVDAGFRVGTLEVSTQAAARTLSILGPQEVGEVLLLEVGHGTSDVIVREESLLFTRSASVGCGSDPGDGSGWLKRLEQEVVRSLVAARTEGSSEQSDAPPGAILLAGGGACLPELREALDTRFKVAPEILAALPVDPLASEEELERAARFVVARGLAETNTDAVPLLDLAHREQTQADLSNRRRVVAIAGLALLLLIALISGGKASLDEQEERAEALRTEQAGLEAPVQRAKRVKKEIKLVEKWDQRKGRELEGLLTVTRALPGYDKSYLLQYRWSEGKPIRLTGRAKDWNSVGAFISKLEQDPLVDAKRTPPPSIYKPKQKNALGWEFTEEVTLVQPKDVGTP